MSEPTARSTAWSDCSRAVFSAATSSRDDGGEVAQVGRLVADVGLVEGRVVEGRGPLVEEQVLVLRERQAEGHAHPRA